MDILVANDEGLVQQKEKIEETLGHALIFIKMMDAFNDTKQHPHKIICIEKNKIFEFLKTIIIGYNVQNSIVFDTCYIQEAEETTKKKKESFKELIKNF